MSQPAEIDVIYDWNTRDLPPGASHAVSYVDETLRDGIQCPSVTDPNPEQKRQIIRLLSEVGVHHTNIGLPGAGPRAVADVTMLAEMIRDEKLGILPTSAARTHEADVGAIIDIAEKTGVQIEAMTFLGASPIRLYAEGWDEDLLEKRTRMAVRMAKKAGLPCTFVTEDTVRSHPTTLRRLFTAAIEEGADGLCLCDTCGHVTPAGIFSLIRFTKELFRGLGRKVRIDWHGHNDRGLGLYNAMAAIEAGADRVHGCILGIGERVGNTSLDQLLVNERLRGAIHGDLSKLGTLVDLVSEACSVPIPVGYPVFGRDAFRTGTGVHAAAIIKAINKGNDWLADRVYSGVPADWFGRHQVIEIGHQAGDANILYWLRQRKIEARPEIVAAIREKAKAGNRVLEEAEILEAIEGAR
jgi:2-isopropylmalate synthase